MKEEGALHCLVDIGNTHTHLGWHDGGQWVGEATIKTSSLCQGELIEMQTAWKSQAKPTWAAFCSVVPHAGHVISAWLDVQDLAEGYEQLTHDTITGITVDYPQPETIGADRLANAMAAANLYGAPSVVVDFGTALTFDVVNDQKAYVGGIIAPGISLMTDYFNEKTALLPKITVADPNAVIGKSTEQAMQIGAVHGYRGLVASLIDALKQEMNIRRLPVIATGGYAALITQDMKAITAQCPHLTLEGLRLLHPLQQA